MPFAFWKRWKRRRWSAKTRPPEFERWSNQHVRCWGRLAPDQQQRLQEIAWIMFHERHFETVRGFSVTDEMKWVVVSNAALMLLGVTDYYFDGVQTILIQPEPFILPQKDRWTIHHVASSGAAWQDGPIVLAWSDCQTGSQLRRHGRNVIIHEFAHHLDGLDGEMGGAIHWESSSEAERWDQLLAEELESLQRSLELGHRTLLDPYAATNSAEFFAVACEYFFEEPSAMREHHQELYEMLAKFYHFDPLTP
ncbi:MAG: zinc-dependent peptidase [Planctomycetaceae bacterium]|nr:zinc-dependent peptidase [Planctomycetaceae bacterium]